MRRPRIFWAVALLLPILHFLLRVGFGMGAWAPDLLTVGVLLVGREVRPGPAAALGLALGLLEDAFSVLSFGANAMALCIVGILGARSRDLFLGDSLLFLVSYIALGSWVKVVLHWLFAGDGGRGDLWTTLAVQAPVSAVYAAAVGTFVLLVTGAWSREIIL
ncbi:MAG: hypothetical protein EXR92_07845 [Gemmatimonadetes bacterium]|nr:hypothetical protein [Gemmatimonadota bacterium]